MIVVCTTFDDCEMSDVQAVYTASNTVSYHVTDKLICRASVAWFSFVSFGNLVICFTVSDNDYGLQILITKIDKIWQQYVAGQIFSYFG